jgi:DNA polymerase III delta prime subunit
MELNSLISDINKLKEANDPLLKSIPSVPGLLEALKELEDTIGMKDAKLKLANQIKFFFFNIKRGKKMMGDNMLNVIISGPPGVGKTTFGIIYSKILRAFGTSKNNQDMRLTIDGNATRCNAAINELKRINEVVTSLSMDINKYQTYMMTGYLTLQPIQREHLGVQRLYGQSKTYFNNLESEIKKIKTINIPPIFPDASVITNKPTEIKVVSRKEFVDQYVGATALKTTALLEASRGEVLFVDEAYTLYHDDRDSFGFEALTTLNKFMSENPNEVFIFAGYANLLRQTVFKAQPGLERRFSIIIEIEGYTGEELFSIFEFQLSKKGFTLSEEHSIKPEKKKTKYVRKYKDNGEKVEKVEKKEEDSSKGKVIEKLVEKLVEEIKDVVEKKEDEKVKKVERYKLTDKERVKKLIIENKDKFTAFGGDTSKIVSQIEILHATYNWMESVGSSEISYKCASEALEIVLKNKVFKDFDDKPPEHMYV